MFFRKLVAILLLGLYGVPAALGPHWHHHRCTEGGATSCTHTLDQATHASASLAQHSHPHGTQHSAHHSCCHHTPTQLCTAQPDLKPGSSDDVSRTVPRQASMTVDVGHDHGPCAICAFYASAQLVSQPLEMAVSHDLVSQLSDAQLSVPSITIFTCQARGPPV